MAYNRQKNLVGSISTFSTNLRQDATITCKNCYQQQRDNVLSRAQVPLTRVVSIEDRKSQETAMDYFKKNLKWIAVHETGEVINKERLTDLDMTLLIGVNELRDDVGRKSLFRFDDYRDQAFDWDSAYASE